jgi:hypothetical protein
MDARSIRDVAAAVAAGAGLLLLADLSLDWYSVSVTAAGITTIKTAASGWTDIGFVAGLLTIAMLLFMIRPTRRSGEVDVVQAAVTGGLALAVLGFTIAAALTGTASITAPATDIQVGSTLWPAYVGIGLAAAVAAGALTAAVEVLRGVTAPSRAIAPQG